MNPRRLCFLACGVLLVGAGGLLAQDNGVLAPELFERTKSAAVHVRHETLPALTPGRLVRLNVSPDAAPREGVITSAADTALGSHVLRGRIKDSPGGSFLVATHGTAAAASVWFSPGERYTLDANGLRREPPGSQVRCACAADPALRPARALRQSSTRLVPQDAVTGPLRFDVLVVYTPAALAAEGGSADAVAAQAELAMADANACYANSGVYLQGNIVGVQPVDYTESGEIHTDLHRLATPGDGYLDEVQGMRDAAQADMVCLFTNKTSADGYNGYAEILTSLRPDAEVLGFSVVNITQATVDHLFAHELGHNMGCDHDRENTTGLRLFPFSYGWRFTGTDGVEYRDVMAYPPGESVGVFGSPFIFYQGTPTGVADYADTARTINESAPVFMNFRPNDGIVNVAVRAQVEGANVLDRGNARASFKFERTGSTAAPLTVAYATGGTAIAGDAYKPLPGTVTFPAGDHFAVVRVTGRKHPAPFGAGTITLTLHTGDGYFPVADPLQSSDTSAFVVLNDRLPLVALGRAKSKADGTKATFTIFRFGLANAVTIPYTLGGTATAGVDYRAPADAGSAAVAAGQGKAVVKIKLLTSGDGHTLTLSVTPQPGVYNVAPPGTADFTW